MLMRYFFCLLFCAFAFCSYGQEREEDAFDKAVASFEAGDHADAITLFTAAIKEDPERVNAYFNRAQCYSILGEHAKAVADISKAIEWAPNDKELYHERGVQLNMLELFPKAEADLSKAITLDSGYVEAIIERSYTYEMQDRLSPALTDLNWAFSIDSSLNIYLSRALIKKRMGDLKGALVDYDSLIARLPNDIIGLYNRAILRNEMDDTEGAIEDYYVALEVDSNYSNAWFNLMTLLVDVEEYQEAVDAASKVIALEPKAYDAYYERGNAYYLLKQDRNACADWSKAQELGSTLANEVLEKYCDNKE